MAEDLKMAAAVAAGHAFGFTGIEKQIQDIFFLKKSCFDTFPEFTDLIETLSWNPLS